MKLPYDYLICTCAPHDPPCDYCASDSIVAVYKDGRTQYVRESTLKKAE